MATAKTTPKTDSSANSTADQAAATYIVGATPVLHDGTRYAPGDEIELTPDQAQRLGLQPAAQVKE